MKTSIRTSWQTILVWALFLASIGTLSVNSIALLFLPAHEQTARNLLREASLKLADSVASDADGNGDRLATIEDRTLAQMASRVLRTYPGVEGGFYFDTPLDRFAGYSFPTERGGRHHGIRRDPPPREEPFIRIQAQQTAKQDRGTVDLIARDVGPSRVIVATSPLGSERAAHAVVWLMYRVTGPEQHRVELGRYRISTFLALGGVIAALLLTWGLNRNLQRERAAQQQLRDELRRSEHLASLGTLLAQVAHEVRNPLAGIRSTVQLWERMPAEARTPESLKAVIGAVDRLDALLHHLLYFSRSENTDRQVVDLNEIVRETIDLLKAQAGQQQVAVEVQLSSGEANINGSAAGLRQVVLNLANNSLQAMSRGGRLTCRIRKNPATQSIELEIEDTGDGIDPAVRARLFEPFFTTRVQGTGLGLALCREIVLQHDGRIELNPAAVRGTICRVILPAAGSSV